MRHLTARIMTTFAIVCFAFSLLVLAGCFEERGRDRDFDRRPEDHGRIDGDRNGGMHYGGSEHDHVQEHR